MKIYAPVVVRVGIALVVLWFGTQQLLHPTMWVSLLPAWTSLFHLAPITLIYMNGLAEIVLGLLLILGIWTRWVGLLVALHLLDIAYTVGYDSIGVRDFGLAVSALSVFFHGSDIWSFDLVLWKQNN